MGGGFVQLFIELCASSRSQLTRTVPHRAVAIRITEQMDIYKQEDGLCPPGHYSVGFQAENQGRSLGLRAVDRWLPFASHQQEDGTHDRRRGADQRADTARCDNLQTGAQQWGDFCWEWSERCDLWKD